MSLDVVADVDAANGVAQVWTYYVKKLFKTDGLARNRTRRRIAVLDEPARILFPKPLLSVDLRVRFCKPLIRRSKVRPSFSLDSEPFMTRVAI